MSSDAALDPEMRLQATAELNKGEARNALAAPSASTGSDACAIVRPKRDSTVPAGLLW
jgi:hypothetical protein